MAETGFLPLLAGMLADSTFNLIRVARGMTVETHTALSPDLFFFFHEIVQCVKSVLSQSSEHAKKPVLCTWKLGPDGKNNIFPL